MADTKVTNMSDAATGVAAHIYAVQSGNKKIPATADAVSFLFGTKVTTAAPMGALAIDVAKRLNTKTISADSTFTFSGTPAASNQWFGMLVTNSDASAHTLTIPSSFSVARAGVITTVIIPASGKLYLVWCYDGSAYNLYGDPPLTSGTGSFVLTTGPSIQLGEAGGVALDAALSATGTWSGITEAGTAGATLAFGDLVYLAAADSRWELADASSVTTSGDVKLGICVLAAAADGDPTTILRFGKVRADAAFPAMTISAPMFVSETAGDITGTKPTTEDAVIRCIGHANTADELAFEPDGLYFTYVP